jgi:hypothetical protein
MGGVQVTGLTDLVKELKGPLFKDVNKELRSGARLIAQDMVPAVSAAVAASGAPQAHAMSKTVRPHSDRVPVVVVGKTNPKFSKPFRGGDTRRRRGAIALGVVAGPAGGKRATRVHENYYRIPRNSSWGALGKAVRGPILRQGEIAYLKLYVGVLKAHGFKAST